MKFWRDVDRTERKAYKTLTAINDAKAVARGRVPRRVARRVAGRAFGKTVGRWLG